MEPVNTFACLCKDINVRSKCSSGGVFLLLANKILSFKGVVYGVAMTIDCYSAEYIRVTNRSDLQRLYGSKYLQARVGNTFKNVKEDLENGRYVLFSGTSCQVNGLKRFLGKEYSNLVCVDVICHGVPSPALWEKYAKYQEKINDGKLTGVNFRNKDGNCFGFGLREKFSKNVSPSVKKMYVSKDKDPYMQMFLRDYCLRPSCYNCVSKRDKMSDLTIADFWGISTIAPEMDDGKGTSLVLVKTDAGRILFDKILENLIVKSVSYEDGVKYNPSEYKSCQMPEQRNYFFNDMNIMSFEELESKYIEPIKQTILYKLKVKIKIVIKLILFKLGMRDKINDNTNYFMCYVFDNLKKEEGKQ